MRRLARKIACSLVATAVGLGGFAGVGCAESGNSVAASAAVGFPEQALIRSLSTASQAFSDERDNGDDTNDVVEAAITVTPSPVEAKNPDQTAQDKSEATATSGENAKTPSSNAASTPEDDVATDYGLPADSPLFSGVEEDVEVSSKKSAEAEDTEEATNASGSSASESSAADEASSEDAEANTALITLVPDDDWLERGNAVLPLQLPDSSFIYDTSIQELSNADPYLDNQTVQVTGEAIGDSIRASLFGRSRWVTLSPVGSSATVSVFMSEESAAKIDAFGRYGVRGTILRVRGTFYLVCPEHDGATDLHAEEVTVVKPGESVHESFKWRAFVPGIILLAIGFVMVFVFSRISERRR